jgi:hypothetical protein
MNPKDKDNGQNSSEPRAHDKSFKELFEEYKSQVSELQNKLNLAEDDINKTQERAILAEDRAERAEEIYRKALGFKATQYERLIHDLFEVPKNNLEKNIRRQSRNSILLIVTIAISSMAVSFFVIRSTYEKSLNQLAPKIDRTIELLEKNGLNSGSVKADSGRDALRITIIAEKILLEKSNFNDYRTKNDVALAYKLAICWYMENVQYNEYISAFNLVGLPDTVNPKDEGELKQWDSDYISLCNKALAVLRDKDGKIEDDSERQYKTYKTEMDTTDYKDRGFVEVATYKELRDQIKTSRTIFQNQLNFNSQ